jgi:MFS family permease
LAFAVQLWQLVLTIMSLWLIESAGRRAILLIGAIAFAGSTLTLALASVYDFDGFIAVTAIFIFIGGFGCGWGGMPWFIASEINESENLAVTNSLGGASNWLTSFLVVLTAQPLQAALGASGLFFFFAANCFVLCVFIFLWVPETKGRPLKEITRQLSNSSSLDNLKKLLPRSLSSQIFAEPDSPASPTALEDQNKAQMTAWTNAAKPITATGPPYVSEVS